MNYNKHTHTSANTSTNKINIFKQMNTDTQSQTQTQTNVEIPFDIVLTSNVKTFDPSNTQCIVQTLDLTPNVVKLQLSEKATYEKVILFRTSYNVDWNNYNKERWLQLEKMYNENPEQYRQMNHLFDKDASLFNTKDGKNILSMALEKGDVALVTKIMSIPNINMEMLVRKINRPDGYLVHSTKPTELKFRSTDPIESARADAERVSIWDEKWIQLRNFYNERPEDFKSMFTLFNTHVLSHTHHMDGSLEGENFLSIGIINNDVQLVEYILNTYFVNIHSLIQKHLNGVNLFTVACSTNLRIARLLLDSDKVLPSIINDMQITGIHPFVKLYLKSKAENNDQCVEDFMKSNKFLKDCTKDQMLCAFHSLLTNVAYSDLIKIVLRHPTLTNELTEELRFGNENGNGIGIFEWYCLGGNAVSLSALLDSNKISNEYIEEHFPKLPIGSYENEIQHILNTHEKTRDIREKIKRDAREKKLDELKIENCEMELRLNEYQLEYQRLLIVEAEQKLAKSNEEIARIKASLKI